jgi:hypothetical protein
MTKAWDRDPMARSSAAMMFDCLERLCRADQDVRLRFPNRFWSLSMLLQANVLQLEAFQELEVSDAILPAVPS